MGSRVIDLTQHRLDRGLPAGRTLHLVDLENLAGGPFAGVAAMVATAGGYRRAAHPRKGDHVVVAVNPHIAYEAGSLWPGARLLAAHGPDGADRALLAEADPDWVSRHYDRVVIGSGDHIFAALAWQLRAAGLAVVVVARRSHLAAELRRAAALTRYLPEPAIAVPAGA